MKKALVFILSVILLCTCAACSTEKSGNSSSQNEKSSSVTQQTTAEPEATYIADNDSLSLSFIYTPEERQVRKPRWANALRLSTK